MKLWHLVARFVTAAPPHPPSVDDEVWAEGFLTPAERRLWIRFDNHDRRHSIRVARRFVRRVPDAEPAVVAGALLHDIGKVRCGIGVLGRVVATIVGPRTERFRCYHDHERVGAEMLAAIGSDRRTVELAGGAGPFAEALEACDRT
jgi:hypothetical protein